MQRKEKSEDADQSWSKKYWLGTKDLAKDIEVKCK